MNILLPTAELTPLARVGGLAEAVSGLLKMLRRLGADVVPVLPDYAGIALTGEESWELDLPEWCGPVRGRRGVAEGSGEVILISSEVLAGPHPYIDPDSGEAWADLDHRFMVFSAAVAAVSDDLRPDVLHLNDWHTAAALGFIQRPVPTVLTVHTLGYQGVCDASWLDRFEREPGAFAWFDVTNPLAGGIRLADRVVAVSPNYAAEILAPEGGMGLHHELAAKGESLVGIRNGIDTDVWDPLVDPLLESNYGPDTVEEGKAAQRRRLIADAGWEDDGSPILGVVSRLVDQKGIEMVLGLAPYLASMPARVILLGSGLPRIADEVRAAAAAAPDRIWAVTDRYDESLAHRIFAGSDLFLMPSRFEPCGLAQMQAMAYGTPTVATRVGGLVDTVVDLDTNPRTGQGFLAATVDAAGFVDATHRGLRSIRLAATRRRLRDRAMGADWSWRQPAQAHLDLYRELNVS